MIRLGITLIVILSLIGCSFIYEDEDYQTPEEYATEQSEYIIECVVNKDKEGLKAVFSKHISETHDLDKEIDEFFEFIDGEIASYDEPEGRECGGIIYYGECRERELNGWTENIMTDTGKKYRISFMMYQICKSNPDYVGVELITITDKTDTKDGERRYIGLNE